jgi:hypothetical protein
MGFKWLKIGGEASQGQCDHFMAWDIQGGYAYYRCYKCNYIDGQKTFSGFEQDVRNKLINHLIEWAEGITISSPNETLQVPKEQFKNDEELARYYTLLGYDQAIDEFISYLYQLKVGELQPNK